MMKLFTLAAVVSASAASETFKWNKNNDFSNTANWANGVVPTGVVDLASGCVSDFGPEGGVVRIDKSGAMGSIVLPRNGEIKLMEGVILTINGEDTPTTNGAWRCKDSSEFSTTCSDNFLMKTGAGWVPADTAPCYADVMQIEQDAATSVIWGNGQYLRSVELLDDRDNAVVSYKNSEDLEVLDNTYQNIYQGPVPVLAALRECGGAAMCQTLCVDSCPSHDVVDVVVDRDEFFSLPEDDRDKIIEDVQLEQDALNTLRFDATTTFNSNVNKLAKVTEEYQTAYEEQLEEGNYTARNAAGVSVTIPEVVITAAQMANWMASASIGSDHAVHYLRHSLSKENAEKTLTFYDEVANGARYYGTEDDVDSYTPMTLNAALWTAIDAKGVVRERRQISYATVMDFILADANRVLGSFTDATDAEIERYSAITAVAADAQLTFDSATGGFVVTNLVISSDMIWTNNNDPSDIVSGVAIEIIESALATSLTRMAMFARAEILRLAIHNKPTTTWSPTTSPTMTPTTSPTTSPTMTPTTSPTPAPTAPPTLSPTGGASASMALIPIAAGGAGGLLLIIIIIVLVVIILSRGKPESKDDARNVVAFENPMYDDPARNTTTTTAATTTQQPSDAALYDEPTFNSNDKANPMYASNEDVVDDDENPGVGDYLDVAPDSSEDESEDEDSDDDE